MAPEMNLGMTSQTLNWMGASVFAVAVIHSFSIKFLHHWALRCKKESAARNLLLLLSEVEIVFGFWAALLMVLIAVFYGKTEAIQRIENSHFTEPLFVFAVMAVASTRPLLSFASQCIETIYKLLPITPVTAFYCCTLILGPLLGSFITEPAAMTVTAFILQERYFRYPLTDRAKYVTLGTLFVNVSIGGVLTHYAAPPVLMVAHTWNWNTPLVFNLLGWKAIIAVLINTCFALKLNMRDLKTIPHFNKDINRAKIPFGVVAIHLVTLALIVATSHYPAVFLGVFVLFLGFTTITSKHQSTLNLRQSLLVAFFLAGLVVLGGFQQWWLEDLLLKLDSLSLFLGATALTAFTDNAALTYLGSQVPNISELFKYALVAGALAGGGLTVIANAPNPIGFSILSNSFGREGMSPLKLFQAALFPTLVAMICFWALPFRLFN
jgi:hypothetical protein